MNTKVCTLCLLEKSIDRFARKGKTHQSRCKDCFSLYTKDHYQKNKKYYKDKAIVSNEIRKTETLQFIMDYLKEHPCIDCGEKDPIVLEFDHVRDKKYKAISHMVNDCCSVETINKEIEKCEVRCANCHRRKTAKDFGWYKRIQI